MKPSKIRLYVDLFFCIVFLPSIMTLIPVAKWLTRYPVFLITLVLFLYAMYFAIQAMNVPQKVMQRKWWQIVIFGAVIALIAYIIAHIPYPTEPALCKEPVGIYYRRRIQTVWFLFLVINGYSLSVSLLLELYKQSLLKKELENQKKSAEIALYQAQINPHFFFNTMNTLYGLVVSKSDKAENAFVRFIELLKYTYTLVNTELISLERELDYIKNYIELQKLRLNSHTHVFFSANVENVDLRIPPMLLITFVENAFKYGVSSTRDSEIKIEIFQKDDFLDFSCVNDIIRRNEDKEQQSMGIQNTRTRLELLYTDGYSLESKEHEGKFIVKLKLRIR